MNEVQKIDRRRFLQYSALTAATGAVASDQASGAQPLRKTVVSSGGQDLNMLGAYGEWARSLHVDRVGSSSYLRSEFKDPVRWRKKALARVQDLLASPVVEKMPEVTVLEHYEYDGLSIKKLHWQLPYGPATEAFYLVPQNVRGPLPGVLALHCHGGNKYFGKQKIVKVSDEQHPMLVSHQREYYGGRAWANELAKKGYAVLVHDTFAFESRKILVKDVPVSIRMGVSDVDSSQEIPSIHAYNRWAREHEHIIAKSFFSAGATWPGVFLADDQVALSILASQKEVDVKNIGCCGLSGGGLRSVLLGGIDSRIKAAVCVGMMTTWEDLVLHHSASHTWMMFMPLLAREMDYSELFALQLPKPRMVLNNSEDGLFDINEMKRADQRLRQVYEKAGASDKYTCEFYPGIHKFDLSMQKSAFGWFDKWLKI